MAFIPWRYLVLTPHTLWTALAAGERESILRHELAHLRRRDLWKSLAIRVRAYAGGSVEERRLVGEHTERLRVKSRGAKRYTVTVETSERAAQVRVLLARA